MAIQGTNLRAMESDWYRIRSGCNANAPLSQHQSVYWKGKGGTGLTKTELERTWLQKVGTSTSTNPFELWAAACRAQSANVGKSIDDCKWNFFTKVASGTNP